MSNKKPVVNSCIGEVGYTDENNLNKELENNPPGENAIENVRPVTEELATGIPNPFDEYLWMENEEEFDNMVMRQLEEEALMEQCIEAMIEDEKDYYRLNYDPDPAHQWQAKVDSDVQYLMNNLTIQDAGAAKGSSLNPLAEEFVPHSKPASSSGSTKEKTEQ